MLCLIYFLIVTEGASTTANLNIVVGEAMIPHSVRSATSNQPKKKKVFRITTSAATPTATTSAIAEDEDEEYRKYMEAMRELGAV